MVINYEVLTQWNKNFYELYIIMEIFILVILVVIVKIILYFLDLSLKRLGNND